MLIKKHKKAKIIILSITIAISLGITSFFVWANDYYHAENIAVFTMQGNSSIKVINNLTVISPTVETDTGIIFYPGAKVEAISYLPLLNKLKSLGYTCVLVKMPLNMAIFNENAANDVIKEFSNINHWYIAGHSMGGAMASSYAAKHQDKVEGLILLGSYIYGNYPPEKSLTIYGSYNSNLEKKFNYTENIIKIEGGNHAQFGNYGKQKGDPDATITADEQQNITACEIDKFISSNIDRTKE